jgi:hypothetical protein
MPDSQPPSQTSTIVSEPEATETSPRTMQKSDPERQSTAPQKTDESSKEMDWEVKWEPNDPLDPLNTPIWKKWCVHLTTLV